MKTTTHPLFAIALFFIFFPGLLQAQKEQRSIEPFDAVVLQGHYSVVFTQGQEGTLIISGKKEATEQVETYVKNNTLMIKQKESSWWSQPTSGAVKIEVPVKQISKIGLYGSGNIRANHSIQSTSFKADIAGSGDIDLAVEAERVKGIVTGSGDLRLRGKANETYFEVTGSGDIKAKELMSNESSGHITGSGSIDLYAKAEMEAKITGSGDLNCYGHPPLHKTKVTGSGAVHFKD